MGPDRRWRCCRRKMQRATSLKWCSGYPSGLTSKDTTQTRTLCSPVLPSFHTSTLTSRRPDRMPGNFCKPMRLDRTLPVRPCVCRAPTNASRGTLACQIPFGWEPVVGGRCGCGADVHGGARHHHRCGALRYIVGGLSATVDDGEWVLTSYLAANAIILPITG